MIPLDTGENPELIHYILAIIILTVIILAIDTALDSIWPWWELRSAQFWFGFRMAFVIIWSVVTGKPIDWDNYNV